MGSRNQQTKVGKDHLVRGYWALSQKMTCFLCGCDLSWISDIVKGRSSSKGGQLKHVKTWPTCELAALNGSIFSILGRTFNSSLEKNHEFKYEWNVMNFSIAGEEFNHLRDVQPVPTLNHMRSHRRKFKVKLPTIWTDEKQSREEAERRERSEERRCRCAKR